MTFNEDILFGDMLESFIKQKTSSYWAIENPLSAELIQDSSSAQPPQNNQTSHRFERGLSSSSENQLNSSLLNVPIAHDASRMQRELAPPPVVPKISSHQNSLHQTEPPILPRQVFNEPPNIKTSRIENQELIEAPTELRELKSSSVPIISDANWPQKSNDKTIVTSCVISLS